MSVRVLLQPFFYLPESWNGIDEHLLLLTRHIDSRDVEFVLALGEHDGPQTTTLAKRAGLSTVRLPGAATGAVRRVRDLREVYERVRPHILHMHTPAAGGQAAAALAARLAKAAPVLTVHQYQPWQLPVRSRILNRVTQSLLCREVVAVSADVRSSLGQRGGFSLRGISVIANGIDEIQPATDRSPSARAGGPVRIGYFGRLSREKGVDILIEGLAVVRQQGGEFEAIVVGDGPERAALEALAVARGLQEAVSFLGYVPNASSRMREVDIVAHTPRYEGFGLVILEAMASSKPVVVVAAPGGISEMVVPGETGIVAASSSPADIAQAISGLLTDP
ncbi:MAG: glycosyltransferase family 4 protein, partial [Tepidiformaceae bacterium]